MFNIVILFSILSSFLNLCVGGSVYDKKFNVIKNPINLINSIDTSNHTLYSVRSNKINYQCWIPNILDYNNNNDDDVRRGNDGNELIDNDGNINKKLVLEKNQAINAIKEFNKQNRNKFIMKKNGYWNYIIRYDHDIHQFHQIDNLNNMNEIRLVDEMVLADYKLASWTNDDNTSGFTSKPYYENEKHKDPYKTESDFELIKTEDGLKYVTQRISNGEICDLTGLPRSVTIKYMCNEKITSPVIRSIHEWKTCEYAIELDSNFFCDFEMWTPPKELISNDINCFQDLDNVQFTENIDMVNLQKRNIEPLISGIFYLRELDNENKFSLIVTKDYGLWNNDIEGTKINESNFEKIIMDISLGFQNFIRNRRLGHKTEEGIEVVKVNDVFSFITNVYNFDKTLIGKIKLEQDENGFIVSFFSDDDVPEETNFLEFKHGNLLN